MVAPEWRRVRRGGAEAMPRSLFAALALAALGCEEPPPAPRPTGAPAPEAAPAPPDGFYRARYVEDPDARPVVGGGYARVGERVEGLVEARLYARDNANETYALVAFFGRRRCGELAVLAGGDVLRGSGGGSEGPARCRADFTVDRAHADAVAALAGTTRGDRVELGREMQVELSLPRAVYAPGEPVVAELRVASPPGAPPFQYQHVEDPRLRRTRLLATRDGVLVPERGGPMGLSVLGGARWERLEPGERGSPQPIPLHADLDLSMPGRYRVTVTTDVELAPADVDPRDERALHRRWTREVTAALELEVR